MGKSPGKWIRTLFSKRSSKTQGPKKNSVDRNEWNNGKTSMGVNSPVISQPTPVNVSGNGNPSESEMEQQSCLPGTAKEVTMKQTGDVTDEADGPGKAKLERAAVKAQAAFRGYLARRAFRALRGIIRLQAVLRGHLVRRQAVATFQCTIGLVRLQALVRGHQVRLSYKGSAMMHKAISTAAEHLDASTVMIASSAVKFRDQIFIYKLISGTPIAEPLQLQYVDGEPNSAWNWLERWTLSHFWKPPPKPKEAVCLKHPSKNGTFPIETESGRPKRSVRRIFSSNSEHAKTNANSESEKVKHNPRKYPTSQAETVHENSQSEFEKIKRNLRKITNSATTIDQANGETEKPKHNVRVSNPAADDKKERIDRVVAVPSETDDGSKPQQHIEHVPVNPKPMVASNSSSDHNAMPSCPLQGTIIDDNCAQPSEVLMPKEDIIHENQKTSRRRASFSSKSDYPENALQDIPRLPSYMAATESAKAKLRGQMSPRLSSDGADKNGVTRRHSLPSSNTKLASQSPRVQRIQTSGKGGVKTERSLSSSRDDKPVQIEWRR